MNYNEIVIGLCEFLKGCDFITEEHLKMMDFICNKKLYFNCDKDLVVNRANILKERYKDFEYKRLSQVYSFNYSYLETYDNFKNDMIDFLIYIVFRVKKYDIGPYCDEINPDYFALVAARYIPFEDFDKYIRIYTCNYFKNFYNGIELNSIKPEEFVIMCNEIIGRVYDENKGFNMGNMSLKSIIINELKEKLYSRYHNRRA